MSLTGDASVPWSFGKRQSDEIFFYASTNNGETICDIYINDGTLFPFLLFSPFVLRSKFLSFLFLPRGSIMEGVQRDTYMACVQGAWLLV